MARGIGTGQRHGASSMPQLIWAPSALRDVHRLYEFLYLKNPDAARRAVKRIRSGAKILAENPEIGRSMEEMEPEYREWLISFGESGYIVLYRFIKASKVIILAVRHQKEAGYI